MPISDVQISFLSSDDPWNLGISIPLMKLEEKYREVMPGIYS